MRKGITFLTIMLATFLFVTGCNNNDDKSNNSETNTVEEKSSTEGKYLIAYFTMPESDGTDTNAGGKQSC